MGSEIQVEIVSDHDIACPVQFQLVRRAVLAAAHDQGFSEGSIGVRITNDAAIHRINHDHLGHDYPTDVISFDYGSSGRRIEGEMVVSAETAVVRAAELGWPTQHELLLYVVHGTLHIAGLDDLTDDDARIMREGERRVMRSLGIDEFAQINPDLNPNLSADQRFSKDHPQEEQA